MFHRRASQQKGLDVSLLARGDRATRLERDGLQLHDAITNQRETVALKILQAPVTAAFDLVMVCVQGAQRASVMPVLLELPGQPTVWYLGNTTAGYDAEIEQLGSDRVLGGFPGVGGTWDGEVLVFADREKPRDKPFDRLTIGEAHPDAATAAKRVKSHIQQLGMNVGHYAPIMAWHWCHLALILPLAAAVYHHNHNLDAVVADRALLKQTMRATAQGLTALRQAGCPILPRGLNVMRWIPAAMGASRLASLFRSDFGREQADAAFFEPKRDLMYAPISAKF